MGRPRLRHHHLPKYMRFKNGAYYFVKNNKWIWLSRDFAEACKIWAQMMQGSLLQDRTIAGLIDRYRKEFLPLKAATTIKTYHYHLQFIHDYFGKMLPQDVTPVIIYRFMDIRKIDSLFSANKERAILSEIFTMAIRWGIATDNPCRHVKAFREPKRDRYIEDWEFKAVYDIAPNLIKCVMMIAYITGLRLADVLAIKLSDLSDEGLLVKVQKTRRFNKTILISWSPALLDAIQHAKQLIRSIKGLYLICNEKGQPYTPDGFKSLWQRLMNRCMGFIIVTENKQQVKKQVEPILKERFRFHDIRRKAATDAEKKQGREFARQLLGHSTQKMTENYIAGVKKVSPLK